MATVNIYAGSNPNEYDDEAFLRADLKLTEAVEALWEAGGDTDNIAASVKNALENNGA